MSPMQLITFAKSRIEKVGRSQGSSVIGTADGDNERDYDSEIFQGHGIVSRPSRKTRGIRVRIGNIGIVIAAYTYGVTPPENEGACKLYSTDAAGTEKASVVLDSDGKVKVNGGSDFAVRFSSLETAFNELKGKYNSLVTAYNAHVHTGVTTGSGSSGTTASAGTASAANIAAAKVSEVLLP